MAMTLTQARARVRKLIDDSDTNPVNADSDVDDALTTAQIQAMQMVVGAGSNLFAQEALLSTTSAGLLDLTSQRALKIRNVQQVVSNTRLQVSPGGPADVVQKVVGVVALAISFTQRPLFPVLVGDNFVWGTAAVENPLLDKYMCVIAASELWGNVQEKPHANLETRKAEIRDALEGSINIPSWRAQPLKQATSFPINRSAAFQWIMTAPHQLQLVYP